jgi:hypothetical protein
MTKLLTCRKMSYWLRPRHPEITKRDLKPGEEICILLLKKMFSVWLKTGR